MSVKVFKVYVTGLVVNGSLSSLLLSLDSGTSLLASALALIAWLPADGAVNLGDSRVMIWFGSRLS